MCVSLLLVNVIHLLLLIRMINVTNIFTKRFIIIIIIIIILKYIIYYRSIINNNNNNNNNNNEMRERGGGGGGGDHMFNGFVVSLIGDESTDIKPKD